MIIDTHLEFVLLSSYQITISCTYKVHLLCRCHASKGRTSCPWYSARSPVNDPNVHCRNKWPEWPGARMVSWLREKSGWILLKWKLQPLSNHCKPLLTTINHYEPQLITMNHFFMELMGIPININFQRRGVDLLHRGRRRVQPPPELMLVASDG